MGQKHQTVKRPLGDGCEPVVVESEGPQVFQVGEGVPRQVGHLVVVHPQQMQAREVLQILPGKIHDFIVANVKVTQMNQRSEGPSLDGDDPVVGQPQRSHLDHIVETPQRYQADLVGGETQSDNVGRKTTRDFCEVFVGTFSIFIEAATELRAAEHGRDHRGDPQREAERVSCCHFLLL